MDLISCWGRRNEFSDRYLFFLAHVPHGFYKFRDLVIGLHKNKINKKNSTLKKFSGCLIRFCRTFVPNFLALRPVIFAQSCNINIQTFSFYYIDYIPGLRKASFYISEMNISFSHTHANKTGHNGEG